jgi:hypothetical protein
MASDRAVSSVRLPAGSTPFAAPLSTRGAGNAPVRVRSSPVRSARGRLGNREGGEHMKKYSKPKAKKVSFGAVLANVA